MTSKRRLRLVLKRNLLSPEEALRFLGARTECSMKLGKIPLFLHLYKKVKLCRIVSSCSVRQTMYFENPKVDRSSRSDFRRAKDFLKFTLIINIS